MERINNEMKEGNVATHKSLIMEADKWYFLISGPWRKCRDYNQSSSQAIRHDILWIKCYLSFNIYIKITFYQLVLTTYVEVNLYAC